MFESIDWQEWQNHFYVFLVGSLVLRKHPHFTWTRGRKWKNNLRGCRWRCSIRKMTQNSMDSRDIHEWKEKKKLPIRMTFTLLCAAFKSLWRMENSNRIGSRNAIISKTIHSTWLNFRLFYSLFDFVFIVVAKNENYWEKKKCKYI